MLKKKLKVIAGTLLAVVLISQLAIPYSLTFAFATQSTKDSVSQPISNTSNNPLVSTTEKDKINLEPKSELKPKPKNELIGDNQPLRVKPLTQPKSEDRAASTEKKWKHVVRTKLPDEVGYSYESKKYKLSGLKPNSAIEIKTNYEKDRLIIKATNNLGEVNITYQDLNSYGYVYKPINREDIIYFEGDIPDNEPPKEEKIGYYNLSVLSGIGRNNNAGLSPMIAGVFIEACNESGKVIGSGVTNKDGECILSLKVPMKIQKIKIRQNKEKSPTTVENFNIQYDTVEKEYNIFPRPIRTKLVDKQIAFYNKEKQQQKEYTITVQSIATKEGQPDRSLYDIPIEIYRNDGTLMASGKTSDDGTFKAKIKAFSGEKIKIKQIIDEASRNLDVELDPNEKIISMGGSTADSVVIFSNKDKLDTSDCYVKFNFQFPPNANASFRGCRFNFCYNVDDSLSPIFFEIDLFARTYTLINNNHVCIKRSSATNFNLVSQSGFPQVIMLNL